MSKDAKYRRGVGIMLLNREGKVFVGARIDNTDEAWQMPQGGIDKTDRDEWATALRELEEETGIAPRLVEDEHHAGADEVTTFRPSFGASFGAANGRGRTRTGSSPASSAPMRT